jgi:hypothetical protein
MREVTVQPQWNEIVLICKDCKRRNDGPKKIKTRAVVAETKAVLRDRRSRPRVVMSTCLGVCPKSELAIAVAGSAAGPRVVTLATLTEVGKAVLLLLA